MPSVSKTKEVENIEKELGEAQQAVARLSQQLNNTISSVATLTADVAELKLGLKRAENWAKDKGTKHDNSVIRYE